MATAGLSPEFLDWVSSLAREHSPALSQVARREGLTADEALEVVQDAFGLFIGMRAAREQVGHAAAARALLSTLVRNGARNLRRRHFRAHPHQPLSEAEVLDSGEPPMDDVLAVAAERAQLITCVGRLAELQRKIVTARILEELSGEEVARSLELSPGHVAVLLHRAKRELRACMVACAEPE